MSEGGEEGSFPSSLKGHLSLGGDRARKECGKKTSSGKKKNCILAVPRGGSETALEKGEGKLRHRRAGISS